MTHQIQHQLFLDPYLNHRQRMFLLYQRSAIENEFLCYLYDCIYNFNIFEDLRDSLFRNLNELSEDVISIDMYSSTNQQHNPDNDSTEEVYADTMSDISFQKNDPHDDLENQLLDEIEFQYDLPAFHPSI